MGYRNRSLGLIAATVALVLLAGGCAARRGGPVDPLAEDRRITAEVLEIIAENDDLVAEDLHVETRDGVVVISGVQPDLEGVGRLLERAARVRGVTEVVNRIRILRGDIPALPNAR
jgi:osmotically-inducible protein OsmY